MPRLSRRNVLAAGAAIPAISMLQGLAGSPAERMPVQGFHYPFPSLAHVERAGNGYREIAMQWQTAL